MKIFNKYLTLLFLIAWGCPTVIANSSIDSLLNVLDYETSIKGQYLLKKQAELTSLVNKAHAAKTNEDRYKSLENLFHSYKNFSMDTALLCARQSRALAEDMGDSAKVWNSRLMEAEAYKNLGLYNYSLRILDSLPAAAHETMKIPLLQEYVSVYYSIVNSLPQPEAGMAYKKLMAYRDSLTQMVPNEIGKAINHIEFHKLNGEYREAINIYESLPDSMRNVDDPRAGVFLYTIGEAYYQSGDTIQGLEYLLKAAIHDIRNCDRKYNALPFIAEILYNQGDINHAYEYMICSLYDFSASNAQCRMKGVTSALPIINNAYRESHNRMRRAVLWLAIMAGMLILFLFGGALVMARKNKKLNQDKILLNQYNEKLSNLMREAENLNKTLKSSGQTKNDYIGQLFNLCSDHINLMSQEHATILKIIKKGNLSEVEKAVKKLESPERLASFYMRFDQCFQDIFPDFVDKLNALLEDTYSLYPQQGMLPPELRIFALIRLGINDTTKIASFLHYSNQTVYNYRARVRAHAKNKSTFFDEVAQL